MKVQQGKNQKFLTIPKWVCDQEDIRKGDEVNFTRNKKGEIVISKAN